MSAQPPYFSIVMPTRNRAHLLQHSLQSVLNQDFDDYEVVIVNNNCSDNTDEVVARLATPRVRYVKTGKTLPMPDNWEFAWTQAQGRYVLYLSDDDALLPGTLRALAERWLVDNPPLVTWSWGVYYHPNWHEPARQNTAKMRIERADTQDVPSAHLLESVYRFVDDDYYPRMLNSCADRAALEAVRQKVGRLFYPSCPDYSFMSVALHNIPVTRVIYRPLMLLGMSAQSIGGTTLTTLGEATANFLKEFGTFDFFAGSSLTVPVVKNYVACTFILIEHELRKAGIVPTPICWEDLYAAVAQNMVWLGENLAHAEYYRAELLDAAERISPETRQRVAKVFEPPPHCTLPPSSPLRQIIHSSDALSRLEFWVRFGGNMRMLRRPLKTERGVSADKGQIHLHGGELGVSNIYEMSRLAAPYFDKYFSARR